jgi:uncharacterized cupin superfamily protein
MNRPLVNVDELQFEPATSHATKFECTMAEAGAALGARKLGYNVTRVPPGKRAFPFHNHHANEELFFVLSGKGTLRFGAQEFPLRQGDFIACPPGGAEVAHQIVNSGTQDLTYLAVSTRLEMEICEYPDSGKFMAVGGIEPGNTWPPKASFAQRIVKDAPSVDYWDGE